MLNSERTVAPRHAGTPATSSIGHFRWVICGLLFCATTINYADRQILGILAPTLQEDIGWSEAEYGLIVAAFQTAYAIGLIGVSRLIDLVGTRLGFALAVGWWSVAAMAHGLVSSVTGFAWVRFLLGLGESGHFPAAIKTVAEWFPKRERALVTGIFNSGSNVGAIVAPLAVPWLTLHLGWRWAFVALGGVGLIWIVAWLFLYQEPAKHRRLSPGELQYIRSDSPEAGESIPWRVLATNRQVWGLVLARFLTDPVWWFYLYWGPKFLNLQFGLKLDRIGVPLAVMYLGSNAGGIFGGWISSYLIRRGYRSESARKIAMLTCALLVMPIVFAPHVDNVWAAIALVSLAMAAHHGWVANIFTIASDLFPRRAVGSVTGISGFGGAVGGMLFASAVGFLLQAVGSYTPVFAIAGFAYLLGLGIIHVLSRGGADANGVK